MRVRGIPCVDGKASCGCGFAMDCAAGTVFHECTERGLGDVVADGLAAIGVTEGRVATVMGRPCGCQRRQQALNTFGDAVMRFLRRRN